MVNHENSNSNADHLLAPAILVLVAAIWSQIVQTIVPAPYLDEIFHVGQAENYVQGRWDIWDPKITTPPGLYLVSVSYIKSLQAINFLSKEITSPQIFRSVNVIGSIFLAWTVRRLLRLNKAGNASNTSDEISEPWDQPELAHHTVNICLFPPMFFFYALYYTDVLSALSVLFTYQCYLEERKGWSVGLAGVVSLLFRQTNIFWVSLFLGGLAFCCTIPKGRAGVELSDEPSFEEVVRSSWKYARSYDPPICQASFEDYIKCGISYGIAGVANLPDAIRSLTPYLFILVAFSAFVVWNGGVVLGDKENHIPSLHLSQMLYLWPYITFFSLPILYPHFLNLLFPSFVPSFIHLKHRNAQLPRLLITLPTLAITLAIIHYNTLIHPFTLADNRHYTFYVFRIFLRHSAIKYIAAPIHYLCAWAVIAILSGSNNPSKQEKPLSARKLEKQPGHKTPTPGLEIGTKGTRASFLLLWLLCTAASLITAPLVEPRYFIVPWLIWRLEVASTLISPSPQQPHKPHHPTQREGSEGRDTRGKEKSCDHRLWLETAWFVCVNVGVGYMFLYRGFQWAQEPGVVQRFMW